MGAEWIHMVDNNGAFIGKKSKPQYFIDIKKKFNCFASWWGIRVLRLSISINNKIVQNCFRNNSIKK